MDAIVNFGALFRTSAKADEHPVAKAALCTGRLYRIALASVSLALLVDFVVLVCGAYIAASANHGGMDSDAWATASMRIKLAFFWCTIPFALTAMFALELLTLRRRARTAKYSLIVASTGVILCGVCLALWTSCNYSSAGSFASALCPSLYGTDSSAVTPGGWRTVVWITPWLNAPALVLNAMYFGCGLIALRRERSSVRASQIPLMHGQQLQDLRRTESSEAFGHNVGGELLQDSGRTTPQLERAPSYHDGESSQHNLATRTAFSRPPSYHTYQEEQAQRW
ncbi:hypothetical protein LTR53_016448 [Teratosphaeriaceae sp. CCFEE 6253]|nr:hypothetical protein LTR53_016448 [Teratosphaeriaceae sp. CCFEE 6253]